MPLSGLSIGLILQLNYFEPCTHTEQEARKCCHKQHSYCTVHFQIVLKSNNNN